MTTTRCHLIVRGTVQGVGFRWSCRARAEQLGVAGWVRNRADGSVEVVAEGDREHVDELVAWCHQGPFLARVVEVEMSAEEPRGQDGPFVITD